ncbi:MAG: DUF2283 domain-containing protein [Chloroflexi bacterium]|nr:DUF2283 domain-containing protein [Chloroflexota bacterium]
MAQKRVTFWYDPEGDFLEVIWEQQEGSFRPTADRRVLEKVDTEGKVLGFRILGMSTHKGPPLKVVLPSGAAPERKSQP